MCDNTQWLIAHAFNLLIVPGKKNELFKPTWKEKKDQGIQNHYEREIITIFFDPKLTNEFCSWRRETLYGAPCMASWGGEEGPHEGRASYQVAMSPRLPRDSGTLCLRTKWQAIVRAGAQQWYLWYLRQPGCRYLQNWWLRKRGHMWSGSHHNDLVVGWDGMWVK